MRHLNTEAGKAMKCGGMNETEALAMVTINPAEQLGTKLPSDGARRRNYRRRVTSRMTAKASAT